MMGYDKKTVKLHDENPQPALHNISKVKRYILLNEEGNMLSTADRMGELHNLMLYSIQGDQDRGFEIYYYIVKAGNLVYSIINSKDWILDDDLTKGLQSYVCSRSGYKMIKY